MLLLVMIKDDGGWNGLVLGKKNFTGNHGFYNDIHGTNPRVPWRCQEWMNHDDIERHEPTKWAEDCAQLLNGGTPP